MSGCSSAVEHLLAKQVVAGSKPVTRSKFLVFSFYVCGAQSCSFIYGLLSFHFCIFECANYIDESSNVWYNIC